MMLVCATTNFVTNHNFYRESWVIPQSTSPKCTNEWEGGDSGSSGGGNQQSNRRHHFPCNAEPSNFLDLLPPLSLQRYIQEGCSTRHGGSTQLPHSWSIAHDAYWEMRTERRNQSILVSGESGAGKTETVKMLLRYLATCSSTQAGAGRLEVQQIADRVEATSPILEAFGNACTRLNDNSSRFGKFLAVKFDSYGLFTGAEITPYLLEKSRVVTHSSGERTYHAFYQMLTGASEEERARWGLSAGPE